VEFNPAEVADRIESEGAEGVRARFENAGILPAGFGLPTNWRGDEADWKESLKELPRLAKAAAAIGGGRTFTWILSCSETRPLEENRRYHIERLRPVAEILGEHGCTFGLEFLGPKTLREMFPHPFLYQLYPMLEMGAEMGANVGVLLDCWHWHTSGGTVEEIRALRPEQVTYVHVNDAPLGVAMEDYVDNVRGLPGETGVIAIGDFLRALQAIGYTGPVIPEPFKKDLADLPSDAKRLQVVGDSVRKIFQIGGLE
jgi:sugar phosphate isomerase/epimerase